MTLTEQKIINGIKYFVSHTKNVGRTKLFKLLYFWDFIHFKRYSLSVTGYDYYTFPFGPVPKDLYNKIINNTLTPSFKKELEFDLIDNENEIDSDRYKSFKVLLKNKRIDLEVFSPNELRVLKEVSYTFKSATAKEMRDITHLPKNPWDITKTEKGLNQPIDYFLSLDDNKPLDLETIKEKFKIQKDLLSDGRI